MADYDDYSEPGMAGWKKGLLIAGLALAVVLIVVIGHATYIAATQSPQERFALRIAKDPSAAEFAKRLQVLYPHEYEQFRLYVEARDRGQSAATNTVDRSFIDEFTRRHWSEAGKASNEALVGFRQAMTGVYERAMVNRPLCQAMMANSINLLPRSDKQSFELLDRLAAAYVVAAASGRDKPTQRGAVSGADMLAVQTKVLAAGFSREDMQNMGRSVPAGGRANPLKSCRMLKTMIESFAGMPPDRAARLTAMMVAQS